MARNIPPSRQASGTPLGDRERNVAPGHEPGSPTITDETRFGRRTEIEPDVDRDGAGPAQINSSQNRGGAGPQQGG